LCNMKKIYLLQLLKGKDLEMFSYKIYFFNSGTTTDFVGTVIGRTSSLSLYAVKFKLLVRIKRHHVS
jgi:hypothetical protein